MSSEIVINDELANKDTRYIRRLWNPNVFLWIGMFFSFLPVSIIYSLNYGRMGNVKKQNKNLIFFIAAFVLIIISIILVSDFVNGKIIKSLFVGLNAGLSIYMANSQKAIYAKYKENGGKGASWLFPIFFCILFVGVIIAVNIYTIDIPENCIQHNNFELYYEDDIDRSEAVKLADFIEKQGYSDGLQNRMSLKISKRNSDYVFSVVVNKNADLNEELVDAFKISAQDFSKYVFNNAKVQVDFCDRYFKIIRTVNY